MKIKKLFAASLVKRYYAGLSIRSALCPNCSGTKPPHIGRC